MTQPPTAGRPDDAVLDAVPAVDISPTRRTAAQEAVGQIPNEVIQLFEESVAVTKRRVDAGGVKVDVRTRNVDEVVRTTLEREILEVVRVPVDKVVDRAPEVRVEGDVTIIPVMEEVVVVEKRLVLREELHVRRRATSEPFEQPVALRRQEATVERLDADEERFAAMGDAP